ncbi:hypothetical protein [Variovorax paradoxus]|uniref:hypothetical protein n=1 Tax=Variovorax paradoxus TaxID=34073 RepID=UPI0012D45B03|nr:hypothetical protein [Variovorax paradoxus]
MARNAKRSGAAAMGVSTVRSTRLRENFLAIVQIKANAFDLPQKFARARTSACTNAREHRIQENGEGRAIDRGVRQVTPCCLQGVEFDNRQNAREKMQAAHPEDQQSRRAKPLTGWRGHPPQTGASLF